MNKNIFAAALASAISLAASSASAATVYAQSVTSTDGSVVETCDTPVKNTNRADICNALGEPDVDGSFSDGGFTSLGNFDSLLFDFGTLFTGPITVWEVTGGRNPSYLESFSFTLMNSVSGATSMGTVANNVNNTADGQDRWRIEAMVGGLFDSLLITDTSSTAGDGFDVDAISVTAVPAPASAALMLAGLGAFGAMRRRKKA